MDRRSKIFLLLVLLGGVACGTQGTDPGDRLQQISGTSPFVRFQGDQSGISVVFGATLLTPTLSQSQASPTVLKDRSETDPNKRYKMWYSGTTTSHLLNQLSLLLSGTATDLSVIPSYIGYATSATPEGGFDSEGTYLGWTDQGAVLSSADIPGFSDPGDSIADPMVIPLSDGFWMFFTGTNNGTSSIYQAFSPDGTAWTVLDGDPSSAATIDPILLPGSSGSWDGGSVSAPSCLIDGSTLRCWYAGNDGDLDGDGDPFYGIGYAECTLQSGVGIRNQPCVQASEWSKLPPSSTDTDFPSSDPLFAESRPLLAEGPSNEFDDSYIGDPTILLDSNSVGDRIFRMWYVGGDRPLIPSPPTTLQEVLDFQENLASTNLGIGVAATFDPSGKSGWERFEFGPVATELSLPVSVGEILCETLDLEGAINDFLESLDTPVEILDQILRSVIDGLLEFFNICELTTLEEALNQDERGPSILKEGDRYLLYLELEFSILSKFNLPFTIQLAANPPLR